MSTTRSQRLDRFGALTGVLMVVLMFGGFALLGGAAGELLDLTTSRDEVARHFAEPVSALFWIGGYVELVGIVLFVPFAAYLAAALGRGEGEPSWLPSALFGSALFFVVTGIVSFSAGATAYYQAGKDVDVDVLLALAHMRSFAFTIGWALGALFLALAAALVFRGAALPRWLGWAAIPLAVALLAGLAMPTSTLAQIPPMLMALWILAASLTLAVTRQHRVRSSTPPRPAVRSSMRGGDETSSALPS